MLKTAGFNRSLGAQTSRCRTSQKSNFFRDRCCYLGNESDTKKICATAPSLSEWLLTNQALVSYLEPDFDKFVEFVRRRDLDRSDRQLVHSYQLESSSSYWATNE